MKLQVLVLNVNTLVYRIEMQTCLLIFGVFFRFSNSTTFIVKYWWPFGPLSPLSPLSSISPLFPLDPLIPLSPKSTKQKYEIGLSYYSTWDMKLHIFLSYTSIWYIRVSKAVLLNTALLQSSTFLKPLSSYLTKRNWVKARNLACLMDVQGVSYWNVLK